MFYISCGHQSQVALHFHMFRVTHVVIYHKHLHLFKIRALASAEFSYTCYRPQCCLK